MKLPFISGGPIGLPIWAMGHSDPVKVLLIDDDSDELSLTRSMLKRVDDIRYEVDWVPTFTEGLTSIARNKHDAYLVDHELGGRTGIELVREAREAGSLAALIMLTGHRNRATDVAAMEAGATDFLYKGRTDAALLDRTLRYSISQAAMLAALDHSRNQMAGLEELGRILVADGPTTETIGRIVDLIVERFFFGQVAIYLADGDVLRLAGQHGHEDPVPTLSRADAGVDRVARAGQPIFLPSLSPEPGLRDPANGVATEVSVPLLLAGELVGLLNVASPLANPIGIDDYSAIRLIGDRLTAALEVTRERKIAGQRLAKARGQQFGGDQPAAQEAVIDDETRAYRRVLLEPLLEVAISSAGVDPDGNLGMLLVACNDLDQAAVTRFVERARTMYKGHPRVRFAEGQLVVLVNPRGKKSARSEADDLVTRAQAAELELWYGYAPIAADSTAVKVIAAAEASLTYARRVGPGTIIG